MSPRKDKRKSGATAQDIRKGGFGAHVASTYSITRQTCDEFGMPLGSAVVHLFATATDTEVAQLTSDAVGMVTFAGLPDTTTKYYMNAYKAGSPDLAGTTSNDITAS